MYAVNILQGLKEASNKQCYWWRITDTDNTDLYTSMGLLYAVLLPGCHPTNQESCILLGCFGARA